MEGEKPGGGLGGALNRLTLIALLLAALEFGLGGWLAPLANRVDDWLLRLRPVQAPDPAMVIVDIDEHSLEQMATEVGRYPWPRSVHAELIEGIARQRPAAIVFDILFSDPDLMRPEGDAYLAEVARATPNTFFPMLRLEDGNDAGGVDLARYGALLGIQPGPQARPDARVALVLPLPALAETGRLGAINAHEEADGVSRRYYLHLDAYGWSIPSLPARVAQALGWELPAGATLRLNWRGPALSYPRVPYAELYRDLGRAAPQRPADEFRDKVVVIGATATALGDLRLTPMGGAYPAVEMVATALDNLKNADPLQRAPAWAAPAVALLLLLGLHGAFARLANPLAIGLGLFALTPLLGAAQYLLLTRGWLLSLFAPAALAWLYYVAAALLAYLGERRRRERSVQIFSRFLDPRVVRQLVERGESVFSLRGQSRQVTVLFSDIRGFTTLSEQRSAEAVVDLLNDYFSRQVKVIFRHGGTMDKFIGDAIMAFWGAPVEDAQQAEHAVAAALEMAETLAVFRQELGESGFDIGIGIHTGPAVVGFIGSDNRLDYTAIGDTVNLASRIEGQTKGVARVLVSAETRQLCGEAFDFVDHGSYKVKGRAQAVQLFEPRRRT